MTLDPHDTSLDLPPAGGPGGAFVQPATVDAAELVSKDLVTGGAAARPTRGPTAIAMARLRKDKASTSMNPAGIRPEAVESIGIVRKVGPKGQVTYYAAIRSQMRDSFEASKKAYKPKVEELGVDWGILNLAATSEDVGGSKLHGSGLLQSQVLPRLKEAARIETRVSHTKGAQASLL